MPSEFFIDRKAYNRNPEKIEHDEMIACDECGSRHVVQTDGYECPVCGTENYPEDEDR